MSSGGLKGLVDKVKGLASKHPQQAEQAVEKAGDEVDQKTGGKFSGQVDTAEQKAEGYLGVEGNQAQQAGNEAEQAGGQASGQAEQAGGQAEQAGEQAEQAGEQAEQAGEQQQ